ncbi:hypothetical protein GCM10018773_05650 [Streptomyces candidus]|nr:hypothetical protein GCM10018773_05650 [Streptomyces candidus]
MREAQQGLRSVTTRRTDAVHRALARGPALLGGPTACPRVRGGGAEQFHAAVYPTTVGPPAGLAASARKVLSVEARRACVTAMPHLGLPAAAAKPSCAPAGDHPGVSRKGEADGGRSQMRGS